MTNYHHRKYEGAPAPEQRKLPPKEPPPPKFHQKTGPKPKPDEEIIDLWKIRPKKGKYRWWWSEPFDSVHIGKTTRMGFYSVPGHVIRRLRAYLVRSNSMDVFWLQNEATKAQISPEFSNYDCFMEWLIYEGFSRGWVWVETGKTTWWSREDKVQKVRKWSRLAKR